MMVGQTAMVKQSKSSADSSEGSKRAGGLRKARVRV